MASSEGRSVQLVSKEGDVYLVPLCIARMSTLVATTTDEDDEDNEDVDEDDDDDDDNNNNTNSNRARTAQEIPLPNVKSTVLAKVIDYCTHYYETEPMTPIQTPLKSSKIEDLVQPWYAEFVKVDQKLLFELVTAANFMDIKPLLDLTCLAVSVLIKGKPAAELRKMFNIGDFTPEEEAQVRDENRWCEQPPS